MLKQMRGLWKVLHLAPRGKGEHMLSKRYARVDRDCCVACGCCVKVCPIEAIAVWHGVEARVEENRCVGCGRCAKECPAGAINLKERRMQQ